MTLVVFARITVFGMNMQSDGSTCRVRFLRVDGNESSSKNGQHVVPPADSVPLNPQV